jgi:hypothetical protein
VPPPPGLAHSHAQAQAGYALQASLRACSSLAAPQPPSRANSGHHAMLGSGGYRAHGLGSNGASSGSNVVMVPAARGPGSATGAASAGWPVVLVPQVGLAPERTQFRRLALPSTRCPGQRARAHGLRTHVPGLLRPQPPSCALILAGG